MTAPVVELLGATRRFGSSTAVERVSFALEAGEILSVLGPSGSGKTTTLRLIAGFEALDHGEIRIDGQTVSSPKSHVPPERRKVGMVVQEFALFPHLTVARNVAFGLRDLTSGDRDERVAETLELVRLDGFGERYPHELSGGEQQRVALARTLAPRPVTVLLDEPFSNIDATMRGQMRGEVEAILRQSNASVILVTHDREEAFAMADRVAVMKEGRVHQIDPPEALYAAPATPFVADMTTVCSFVAGTVQGNVVSTELGDLPWFQPPPSKSSEPPPLKRASESPPFERGVRGDSLPSPDSIPNGTHVSVLVRAADVEPVPRPEGPFVVKSREFRGDETILEIGLATGETLRCKQGISPVEPGTRVAVVPTTNRPFVVFKAGS